jgi:hypothetical protein
MSKDEEEILTILTATNFVSEALINVVPNDLTDSKKIHFLMNTLLNVVGITISSQTTYSENEIEYIKNLEFNRDEFIENIKVWFDDMLEKKFNYTGNGDLH